MYYYFLSNSTLYKCVPIGVVPRFIPQMCEKCLTGQRDCFGKRMVHQKESEREKKPMFLVPVDLTHSARIICCF